MVKLPVCVFYLWLIWQEQPLLSCLILIMCAVWACFESQNAIPKRKTARYGLINKRECDVFVQHGIRFVQWLCVKLKFRYAFRKVCTTSYGVFVFVKPLHSVALADRCNLNFVHCKQLLNLRFRMLFCPADPQCSKISDDACKEIWSVSSMQGWKSRKNLVREGLR